MNKDRLREITIYTNQQYVPNNEHKIIRELLIHIKELTELKNQYRNESKSFEEMYDYYADKE